MIELGLKLTLAYLLGSVLGSLVVGCFRGGVDIRKLGSGNAGGTNALRTQGKGFALWVMVIDVGKGILAAAVIPDLDMPGRRLRSRDRPRARALRVAFAAIVGHVFPGVVRLPRRQGRRDGRRASCVYFAPALALPVIGAWLLDRAADGLRGARDDQRGARGRRVRRVHARCRSSRACSRSRAPPRRC